MRRKEPSVRVPLEPETSVHEFLHVFTLVLSLFPVYWVLYVQALSRHMLPGMGSDKTDRARTQQCCQTSLFSECQRHHAMEPKVKPKASPEWLTGTGFCIIPTEVWEQSSSCFMAQAFFSGLKTLKYSWWITVCSFQVVQQSVSVVTHTHINIYISILFFKFFFIMIYYKIFRTASCAVQ